MRIDILTLFPEMCCEVLRESVIGRARERGCVEINCRNIRDYTLDKHSRYMTATSPFAATRARARILYI